MTNIADAETFVFTNEPIPESEQSVTLDLVREEEPMGSGSTPILVKEAQISIGKHRLMYLPCSEAGIKINLPETETILPIDPNEFDVYILYVPFTLHPLAGKKFYDRFEFKFHLSNENIVALKLFPQNITKTIEGGWTVKICPKVEYKEIGGELGEITYTLPFEKLMPVITAFGIGENDFYWLHEAQDKEHLYQGSHHTVVILEVPRDSYFDITTIFCKAVISRKTLGVWKQSDIHIENPEIITLDFAKTKRQFENKPKTQP